MLYKPWQCVICAVDPGKFSGVSYWVCGRLSGHASVIKVSDYVSSAYAIAQIRSLPLVFVIEKHSPYGKWGHAQKEGKKVMKEIEKDHKKAAGQ